MNRRSFMQMVVEGLAATAAVRTWPFRIYSFPTEIKLASRHYDIIKFDDLYSSGQSKNFATLLAPGLHKEFLDWFEKTNPEEFRYGLLEETTDIRYMLNLG